MREIPVRTSTGEEIRLSPGRHNKLQAAVVTDFGSRFAPGSVLLYLGDAAQKLLHIDQEKLDELRVPFTEHDKLPDVMLYDEDRTWLFLIEAVTSHGPVSPKRVEELEATLSNCTTKRGPFGRLYTLSNCTTKLSRTSSSSSAMWTTSPGRQRFGSPRFRTT